VSCIRQDRNAEEERACAFAHTTGRVKPAINRP
jgi:hypothetical protein